MVGFRSRPHWCAGVSDSDRIAPGRVRIVIRCCPGNGLWVIGTTSHVSCWSAASLARMESGIRVRPAVEQDAPAMARVHVESWRETYRGLMADSVLDDPELLDRREKFWTAVLTDPRYAAQLVAVAERDFELVGIVMAGPAREPAVDWSAQLFVLYTYTAVHGLGVGAVLLDAVIEPSSVVGLWVAEPNPRAQAFYRKHGFLPDGTCGADEGVNEIRMVRR